MTSGLSDPMEVRRVEERRADHERRLLDTMTSAWRGAPEWRRRMTDAGLAEATLAAADHPRLPVLRKSEMSAIQRSAPPFGGLATKATGEFPRIFMSPGPIFDPQLGTADIGGFARGLRLAGFSQGDLVLNTFSYHLTPAGHTFESGAMSLGASVVPAGFGNTEQQLELVRNLAVNAYIGTPSFLTLLASEGGWDFAKACVAGEKMTESERADLEARGGRVHQVYGTADVGYIAGECAERQGMHVTEDALVELLDPATGEPARDGDLGEVTVTTFSKDYPMLRFATGDLSRILSSDPCGCGRTSIRLAGVLGRVGPGVKVRGMFVYEHDVRAAAAVLGLTNFQVVVDREKGRDLLELRVAASDTIDSSSAVKAFRDAIKLTVSPIIVDRTEPDAPVLVDARDIWEA